MVCDAAAASPSAQTHQATGCRSRGRRWLISGAPTAYDDDAGRAREQHQRSPRPGTHAGRPSSAARDRCRRGRRGPSAARPWESATSATRAASASGSRPGSASSAPRRGRRRRRWVSARVSSVGVGAGAASACGVGVGFTVDGLRGRRVHRGGRLHRGRLGRRRAAAAACLGGATPGARLTVDAVPGEGDGPARGDGQRADALAWRRSTSRSCRWTTTAPSRRRRARC